MGVVIVGVNSHKKSVTIEAIDEQGQKVATGRFGTETRDFKAMLGLVRRQWPRHRWAIGVPTVWSADGRVADERRWLIRPPVQVDYSRVPQGLGWPSGLCLGFCYR